MDSKIEHLLKNISLPNTSAASEQGTEDTNSEGSKDAFTAVLREATQQIRELENVTKRTGESSFSSLTQTIGTQTTGDQPSNVLQTVGQDASELLAGGFLGGTSTNTGLPGELFGGGVLSLFSAFSDLFGGSGQQATPLTRYQAPPTQSFEEAFRGGVFSDAVSNSSGSVQTTPLTALALSGLQISGSSAADPNPQIQASASSQQSPQITVNVQAMDSRSFLDHSHDIAAAVRDAMLNMHSMNDVVTDL